MSFRGKVSPPILLRSQGKDKNCMVLDPNKRFHDIFKKPNGSVCKSNICYAVKQHKGSQGNENRSSFHSARDAVFRTFEFVGGHGVERGKMNDIKKILILGGGPIVIGQACEFDYPGTQACKAMKEEGYQVIFIESNLAKNMIIPEMAESAYRTYNTPMITLDMEQQDFP